MPSYTFSKDEHICLKKEIEALFGHDSESMNLFPLRITFRYFNHLERTPRAKVLLSVAKRHLRHAVDRNRAKRQIREAYRLNKETLLRRLGEDEGVDIAFIWLADMPMKTAKINKTMRLALHKIGERIEAKTKE